MPASALHRTTASLVALVGALASSACRGEGRSPASPTPPSASTACGGARDGTLRFNMVPRDTVEVAPGASLALAAFTAYEGPLNAADAGRWCTSDSTVAAWTRYPAANDVYGPSLQLLTARAPGAAEVGLTRGEARASFVLRVRNPGPLAMDEAGTCGLDALGELWCTGTNRAGQLAVHTPYVCTRACWPLDVPGFVRGARGFRFQSLTSSTSPSGGSVHKCALALADSRAHCWGFGRDTDWLGQGSSMPHRLGGPVSSTETTFCPEGPNPAGGYTRLQCSFTPLAADRMLGHTLTFRTLKAWSAITCGLATAPGEAEAIWCWGDTAVPTKRATYPVGFPAPG